MRRRFDWLAEIKSKELLAI